MTYQTTDSHLFDGDMADHAEAIVELRAQVAMLREASKQFIAVIEAHARLHADEVHERDSRRRPE